MICITILSQIIVNGQSPTDTNRVKIIKNIQLINPNGNILYVGGEGPGNFSRIYKAIDAASDGDTIFVFNGTYNECFTVDKSIILMGEDKETTKIVGERHITVRVLADNVTIHGFTIDNTLDEYDVKQYGIHIVGENSTVYDNIIANNCTGICLHFSSDNSIFDNTFQDNGVIIYYSYNNKVYNNMINGKELVYLEQASDQFIDPDAGQAILVNCTNITVKGLDLSYTSFGVQLRNTDNCQIFDNTISKGLGGISLINSNSNTISGNKISYCKYDDGIHIELSSNNLMDNNELSNNFLYGIRIRQSCNNTVSNNLIKENYMGVSCRYRVSRDNIISNNTISDNEHCGVSLDSSNNIVCNNIFSNNHFGGIQVDSYEHQILNNEFHDDGIYIYQSISICKDNEIKDNTINGRPLVYLKDISNKVIDNAGQIILFRCNGITIENQMLNNTILGISLTQTNNCHISKNHIGSNNLYGMRILESDKNTITKNIISDNAYDGIYIEQSDRNLISGNNICNNNEYGIFIYDWIEWGYEFPKTSKFNMFTKNNIMNNKVSGASFLNSIFNRWSRNYWGDPKMIHRINGEIYLERGWHLGSPPPIELEISCIDWISARRPYNI